MVCRYCHKRLPDKSETVCPHCFAKWEPVDELKTEGKKQAKAVEHNTVNGHE